jgi:hypothetical protein
VFSQVASLPPLEESDLGNRFCYVV